jgi:transposase
MSAFGIIHYEIIGTSKSGITAAKFTDFLSNLISLVGPNSKLLLDNAKIHKVNTVLALLDHFQIEYLFSPYSPDYNGIEYLYTLKKKLQQLTSTQIKKVRTVLKSWSKTQLKLGNKSL